MQNSYNLLIEKGEAVTETEAIEYLIRAQAEGKSSLSGDEIPPEIVARLENDGVVTREWISVKPGEIPKNTGYYIHLRLAECRRFTVRNNT